VLGFPLAFVYANAAEWLIHKHVLHGVGKNRASYWSFHFHEHHQAARKNAMGDPDYARSVFGAHAQGKEAFGVLALAAVHTPLLPVAPGFVLGVWCSAALYYRVHRKSHVDPAWGRAKVPWHVDHHMGPNQDANWCVTFPWFDHVMGTREYYVGTERERADQERAARRAARKASASGTGRAAPSDGSPEAADGPQSRPLAQAS
jgi:sterol desaturase/sphingolipid hydroxylase (fatty acid hydroxylase superfamily)